MTKQEILDHVAKHLLKQNARSVLRYGDGTVRCCAYRGENGTSCAVGCLIPDEKYDPIIEGHSISHLYCERQLFNFSEMIGNNFKEWNFLFELQGLHDKADVEEWRTRLIGVATRHDLSVNF